MKLNYFSKTVVGLVRKANEDCIGNITTPNKSNMNLHIVCDGMGGHIGGAKASNIAVNSIREYFSNTPNPVPQVALKEAISFANLQIYGYAQAETEFKGMGTTCTVLLESEGLIYIAHVGDSRIYIHTDKKLYRITKDHSYVQGLVDKGEITDQQMETHPNKNQLTRALGIAAEVEVEVASKPILAKSGDSFLLCSDGLNGLINDRMINSVINTINTLETKCNNLITMAEAAGGHDNISVDLIEVLESEHIKTQFVNKNNEDLIETKTQQIEVNQLSHKKNTLSYLKNKVVISSVLIGAFVIVYLLLIQPNQHTQQPPIEKEIGIIKPISKIDTIKVVTKSGWGKTELSQELYLKVTENVGKENYCNDCPLFYKNGSNESISIWKYKKEVKLHPGDYLMVTVTDGKVDMPKINKREKRKEKEPDNQFSEETKKEKKRKERPEKERLDSSKVEKGETEISEKVGSEITIDLGANSEEVNRKQKKSKKIYETKSDTLNKQ
jgi:serine/threonine protein phosphatase PrpC